MSRLSDSQENGRFAVSSDSVGVGTACTELLNGVELAEVTVSVAGSCVFSSKLVIGKNTHTKDWQS